MDAEQTDLSPLKGCLKELVAYLKRLKPKKQEPQLHKIIMSLSKVTHRNRDSGNPLQQLATVFKGTILKKYIEPAPMEIKQNLFEGIKLTIESNKLSKSATVQWASMIKSIYLLIDSTVVKHITENDQQKKPTPILRNKIPKCPIRECEGFLQDRRCKLKDHLRVSCSKCKWSKHQCPQSRLKNIIFVDEIRIIAKGNKIDHFPSLALSREGKQNNIKQLVLQKGYKFTTRQRIVKGVPEQISCKYPIVSGQARDLVLANRQHQLYLPIQIRKSSIEGAGLGVFAVKQIAKADTLVCSYLGEIGLGSQTPITRGQGQGQTTNDSIFTIGWLNEQILIMAPNEYSNVGRFINYNTPDKCNLKPNLGLLEKSEGDYQLAVFLTTTRKIRAGEELFYEYGADYDTTSQ